LPNLFEDESNKRSVEALLKQLMLMKIMEDVHKVILQYKPKKKKKKRRRRRRSNSEAIRPNSLSPSMLSKA
jgi:hypothetical protein